MSNQQLTLLLIDNSPEDRLNIRHLLAKDPDRHYRFVEAESAAAALEICRRERPHCVLLENYLPDMNGVELLQLLGSAFGSNILPVVMLSGSRDLAVARAALDNGAQDFINKDHLQAEDLQRAIANAMEKAALWQTQQRPATALREGDGTLTPADDEFRLFVEHAPAAIAMLDRQMRYLVVSQRWLTDYGFVERDLLGRSHYEVFSKIPDRWKEIHRRCLAGAVERAEEDLIPRSDGTSQWMRWEARPWFNPSGAIGGIVIFSANIGERKKAEAALSESEERFRLAAGATHAMVYDLDVSRMRLNELHGLHNLLGYRESEADLTLEWWEGRIEPGDLPDYRAAFQRIRSDPKDQAMQYRVRHKDRRRLWVEDHATTVKDATGNLVRLVGTVVDITERKLTEEALRESEARLSSILQHINACIYQMDADSRFIHVNRHFEEIFGLKVEDIRGKSLYDVFPQAIAADFEANNRKVLSGRVPVEIEEHAPDSDGLHTYISIKVPRFDSAGKAIGIVGISTDITQRKQAEEALKQADRKKDEFLAVLAHELRNPLAPIRTGLELLKRAPDDPAVNENIRQMMERALMQTVRMVDDLLDSGRIGSGKLQLRRQRIELANVVPAAVEMSRPLIEEKRHAFSVVLPAEPVTLDGDLARLAQVIANLLNNAAKYSPEGGQIRLSAAGHDGEIKISVQDSGVGIAADDLPRVFDMFTQVESSLEESQGGLGIGLSLAKQLVEMHGGRIEAKSDGIGQGSEFIVYLPIISAEAPAQVLSDAGMQTKVTGKRILIADDNRAGTDSLAMLLEFDGHQSARAYDGVEALKIAESLRPEIILLDIGMPGLNGYEVAQRLRAEAWGKNMVIIAMSGWGQEKDQQRWRERGIDHHLIKPVNPQELAKLIAAL